MARFNEILNGRWARALQKATAIKGAVPTPQLGTELTPSLPLFWGIEMRALEGWNRFVNWQTFAATAAQVGGVQIRLPQGSNVCVVIEQVVITNTNAANQSYLLDYQNTGPTPDLTNPGAGIQFELPRGQSTQTAVVTWVNTGVVGIGTHIGQVFLPASSTFQFITFEEQEIPMYAPQNYPWGAILRVWSNTVNVGGAVGFIWRERVLDDSERFL